MFYSLKCNHANKLKISSLCHVEAARCGGKIVEGGGDDIFWPEPVILARVPHVKNNVCLLFSVAKDGHFDLQKHKINNKINNETTTD